MRAMLAFGNLGASGNGMTVQGWLYDVKNVGSPQVLGKQYPDAATSDAARTTAHKFADEIIFRLGGGIAGIAESKIYFVSTRSGHKEIWAMDYDGANQHAVTRSGLDFAVAASVAGRIAHRFQFDDQGWLGHPDVLDGVEPDSGFPRFGGTNLSPAWSPDGTKLAFSSSRGGDPEIYVGRFFRSEPEADHFL